MILYIILTIVAGILLIRLFQNAADFPPGPKGLPIVGYMPFLHAKAYEQFVKLGKKYGSIFSLKLGVRNAVVLNDWKAIKESFVQQSLVFTGRPELAVFDETLRREDISSADGLLWRHQRRFALRHFRTLGFGKASTEAVIMEQVQKIFTYLEANDKRKLYIDHLFFLPVLNVIWHMIAGKTFDSDDEYMSDFRKYLSFNAAAFAGSSRVNFLPFLRYLPGNSLSTLKKSVAKVLSYLEDEVKLHAESFQDGVHRDFIDAYLSEMYKMEGEDRLDSPFQEKHLHVVLYDFFHAGTETVENSLLFSILYMITWPEIQRKVQEELDRVVGRSRLPTYSDRNVLPYTEATVMEVQRYVTIVPLSLPHCPLKTTKLLNYTIPKGTPCFPNIWGIHHDPELWSDPDVFRPERFLDENGKISNPEYYIPFGVGGRVCIGESIAKMSTFLFFAALVHKFSFEVVTGEKPPNIEPIPGLTVQARHFDAFIKRRW